MPSRWLLVAGLLFFFPVSVFADSSDIQPKGYTPTSVPKTAVWISPTGSDIHGLGTLARPFYSPGRASTSGTLVVAMPGRYREFGSIAQGGTATSPLVIRAASGTVEFALQDANIPAFIRTSHVRLEGITITGEELSDAGTCLQIGDALTDIELAHVHLTHCKKALVAGANWSQGALNDVTISDTDSTGIDCTAICSHQRWNRLLLQSIGNTSTSGTAALISKGSSDIRIRDLTVRDIAGDGIIFAGGKPSLTNALFTQISGTALTVNEGGFIGHTQIETETNGLIASIGTNLVIERSLFHALSAKATPFAIADTDTTNAEGHLLLSWSRFDLPNSSLHLGGAHDQHEIVLNGSVFWFREDGTVRLPGGDSIELRDIVKDDRVIKHEESLFYSGAPLDGDLFSPIFSGGETTRNEDNSRTITTGSLIQGTHEDPPYVLGQNQRVHLFADADQQARWYPYQNEVTTIGVGPFSGLVRGLDVTEPPGTLVKARSRAPVYLVTAPNQLRWITTEALATLFAGPRWNTTVLELPDEDLTHYQEDTPITSASDFEDDDVLRQLPDPADLFDEPAS